MPPSTPFDAPIHTCARCKLRATCRLPVPGDGNFSAPVLFVGEAPGAQEDVANKPFVGRSGKLLTGILEGLGMVRDRDYYISNIVKCRPPENRDPTPEEITACSPWLVEQIRTMKPKVIVTLGRFSFSFLVPGKQISQARGTTYRIRAVAGQLLENSPLVLACYHPAVALYDPRKKQTIIDDLAKLPKLIQLSQVTLATGR